jgi:hypothetical protein
MKKCGMGFLTMAEYINREKAKRLLHIEYAYAAEQLLDEIPAADVAPVVRCKDCKHYLIADEFEGGKRFMCEVNHFSYINSDGDMRYCSYGERKDDKHEH